MTTSFRALGGCILFPILLSLASAAADLSLGNAVFKDRNANGSQDEGEPGIADVYLALFKDGGDGNVQCCDDQHIQTLQTGPDGLYLFTGLQPGRYFIRVENISFQPGQPLFGLVSSPGAAHPDDDIDGDDHGLDVELPAYAAINTELITLSEGGEPTSDGDDEHSNLTLDLGFTAPAIPLTLSVGGTVFRDLNGDGAQQDGEPGIPWVGLSLIRDDGNGIRGDGFEPGISGGSTDDAGRFLFHSLPPGGYFVDVGSWNFNLGGALFGLLSSPGFQPPDNDIDGDDSGIDNSHPVNWGIQGGLVTLAPDTEPIGDGDDSHGNLTVDYAFFTPPQPPVLTVGGSLFRDLNANGLRDGGEPGVPGIGLSLIEVLPDNSEIHQGGAGTDDQGNYRFYGRPSGRYFVRLESWNFWPGGQLEGWVSSAGTADPNLDIPGDDNGLDVLLPRNEGLRTQVIDLANGTEPDSGTDGDDANGNLTLDVGLIRALTLGDRVFRDMDDNGVFTAASGDSGIDGVNVHLFSDDNLNHLLDPSDRPWGGTTTANGGLYRFSGLAPGEYIVLISAENFTPGGALAGLASSPLDETDPNLDGDDNDNGLVTPGYGIASAALTLASGTEPTSEDNDPNTNLTLDFAFRTARPLTLGNLVFADLDNDGRFEPTDGDHGIDGVVVQLWRDLDWSNSRSPSDSLVASVVTAQGGHFEFSDLAPTQDQFPYLLVVPPENFLPGAPLHRWISSDITHGQGSEGFADGLDHGGFAGDDFGISTWQLHLNPGQAPISEDADANTDLTADLGFTPEFRLGNRVWADLNNNGSRDPGEPAIDNVELQLWRDDNPDGFLADGDNHIQSVSTSGGGFYLFNRLSAGRYFVTIPPWNHDPGRALFNRSVASTSQSDPNSDLDDDNNGAALAFQGSTYTASGLVLLSPGSEPTTEDDDPNSNLTLDFGFQQGPALSLGSLVFRDSNANGLRDPDEPGIGGVGLTLFRDGGDGIVNCCDDQPLYTVLTDPDGLYQFTGLQPGDYFLRVEYGSFYPGQPLFGLASSPGVADPDNDIDGDDNGLDAEMPAYNALHSAMISLAPGTEPVTDGDDANANQTLDLGFITPATPTILSVGGTVFHDLNADGIQQPDETGIPHVGVILTRDDGSGVRGDGFEPQIAGTSTDAQGRFTFLSLPPGGYFVDIGSWNFNLGGALFGLLSSPGHQPPDNDIDGDDSGIDNSHPVNWGIQGGLITVNAGTEPTQDGDDAHGNLTVDYAFHSPAQPPVLTVGGAVFRDQNNNGLRDAGEPGIQGVAVSLIEVFPDNSELHQGGTSTDDQGNYRFYGRPAGHYFVRLEYYNFYEGFVLGGLVSTPGSASANANIPGDDNGIDVPMARNEGLRTDVIELLNGTEPEPTVDGDNADGNLTLDFGLVPALSIGDLVFRDADGDGQFNAATGDSGVDGVSLHLFADLNHDGRLDASDRHLASVGSVNGGHYAFGGLAPGDYLVHVGNEGFGPGGALAGLASSPLDETDPNLDGDDNDNGLVTPGYGIASAALTLASGTEPTSEDNDPNTNLTLDFAFRTARPLTLGNLVFADLDNDGRFEPTDGDHGIDGVVVQLWRDLDWSNSRSPSDSLVASVVTAQGGHFEFSDLAPTQDQFPYLLAVPPENFLPGAPLHRWISSDITHGQGSEGFADGLDHGGFAGDDFGISTWQLHLNPGQAPISEDADANTDLTADLGFTPEFRLGNRVWADLNNNGSRDPGEPAIDNVELQLWRDDNPDGFLADGDNHIQSVSTSGGGFYLFNRLSAGRYFVTIPPWNHDPGRALFNRSVASTSQSDPNSDLDDDNNGAALAFQGSTYTASGLVLLSPGSEPTTEDDDPNSNLTLDFGFQQGPALSLGSLVFRDSNANGLRDPDEPGIGGVGLTLFRDGGDGIVNCCDDQPLYTVLTDPDGLYQFTGLQPGDYFLRVEYGSFYPGQPLFGLASSPGVADPDNDIDGDDNGLDAELPAYSALHSAMISLAPGTEPVTDGDDANANQTLDLGFITPATPTILSVGGTVFHDLNADGIQQPDETGIPGVSLTLFRDNGNGVFGDDPTLGGASTDATGHYQFLTLPAGTYFVRVDPWSFNSGVPLFGHLSSPGVAESNLDISGDDNGIDESVPVNWGVLSRPITLSTHGEPTDDGDGADGNQTIGFGFHAPADGPNMAIGGVIFHDANSDGQRQDDEPGIAYPFVSIIQILPDGREIHQGGRSADDQGRYLFEGYPAGTYYVRIEPWTFTQGNPVFGRFSSPGAADSNLDVVGDDNGIDSVQPLNNGIRSRPVTLAHGTEPDAASDGDGPNSNRTLDFALIQLPEGPSLTVGGTVFHDLDNSGHHDPAEPGFANVGIELWSDNGDGQLGPEDQPSAYAGTDSDGRWFIGGLPPGDYIPVISRWLFNPGSVLAGFRSSTGNGEPAPDPDDDQDLDDNGSDTAAWGVPFFGVTTAPVSLRAHTEPTSEDGDDNTNLTVDAGFRAAPPLSIAGTVFRDDDQDGQWTSGEAGIPGVWVELWLDQDGSGSPSEGDGYLFAASTDETGQYRVSPLVPGPYLLVLRYPNFMPGRALNGLRSTGSHLTPEPRIDPDSDIDSDDNGFEFGGWNRPFFGVGTRIVTVDDQSEPDAIVDGDDTNSNATIDFAFLPGDGSVVGDLVFLDANNNGLRDGDEPGIPGVHVKLFYDNGDGHFGDGDEDLGVDVFTDSLGRYQLPGLPAGRYIVVVPHFNWWPDRPLNGLRSSTGNGIAPDPDFDTAEDDDNGDESSPSFWPGLQTATSAFETTSPTSWTSIDFGFYPGPTLTLGGTLFRDSNNNGQRDPDEPGIPNAVVELIVDQDSNNLHDAYDWHAGQRRTDASGAYRFTGLLPGNYAAWISRWEHFYGQALTGLRSSTGNDPAPDPDNDVAGDDNGRELYDATPWWFADGTSVLSLAFGTEPDVAVDGDDSYGNLTLDFGYQPAQGTTFVVTTPGDHNDGTCDADCTLREAVTAANESLGTDLIRFELPGAGPHVIQPTSPLPELIDPIFIDATTQPGFAGTPVVALDGSQAGNTASGLILRAGQSTVRGLAIHGFRRAAIQLDTAPGNVVEGNHLGTDASGTLALGNAIGVLVNQSAANRIGGTADGAANLISGNSEFGIAVGGVNSRANQILGNRIGTDVSGTTALPNRIGIDLYDGSENQVGGIEPGEPNQVAFNTTYGIGVFGNEARGNSIRGNAIHSNGSPESGDWLGIDLGHGLFVNPNDPGDEDAGPNQAQNYPELTTASAGPSGSLVTGQLNSSPLARFVIDLYANDTCDTSGYGEGSHYLGSVEVTTDATGIALFQVSLPTPLPLGSQVTATATDSQGNTSEFSACRVVDADLPPTVISASTGGSTDQIIVIFSEPVDRASAEDPTHYSVDNGVQVLQAILSPDGRTVILSVVGLTGDRAYNLAVTGVTDLSVPPNPIPPGATFAILDTQGVVSRLVYHGIPGITLNDLVSHPSFPDHPSEKSFESAFEAPANVADEYGQRMAGYLVPDTTGDFVFYLAGDDASELWLSPTSDPAGRQRIARVTYWMPARSWIDAPVNAPTSDVFRDETRFIEIEDFDFNGGQWLSHLAIGMNGAYPGGSYAGLGSLADEGIDFHELSLDAPAWEHRSATGVEIVPTTATHYFDRGAFQVSAAFKLGWINSGEWYNFTREFPAPAQDYWVYVRAASEAGAIGFQLDEVVAGQGTPNQTLAKLGEFHSGISWAWDNMVLIPLTDDTGTPIRVNLGGLHTLRLSALEGGDLDYLAFVPATSGTPVSRPENRSMPISLIAGQRYYIEALMKEGTGGDHLAVAWSPATGLPPANGDPPIPGAFLSSLKPSGPVSITLEPASVTVGEHETATFSVDVDGTPPFTVQWYRDDLPISDAHGFTYSFLATLADNGARISATVANGFSSDTSLEAVLTVGSDTTPPALLAAIGSPNLDRVTLSFSEPLAPDSVGDPSQYTIDGGLTVLSATLLDDQRSVRLMTTVQPQAIRHVVTVSGVRDLAAIPNTIPAASTASFTSWVESRGYVLREAYLDIPGSILANLRESPKFPDYPDIVTYETAFEIPTNARNDYGSRLTALLIPPVNGDYEFFHASDDEGELYLGSDDSLASLILIAREPSWNNPRAWTSLVNRTEGSPENRSGPISLQGNQLRRLQAIAQEGGGGDNLGAAWRLPGAPLPEDGSSPIPGSHLIGFVNPDDPAVTVTPYLIEVSPSSAEAGSPAVSLVISGKGFLEGAVVHWKGSPRATAFINGTTLTAVIPASDLATADPPFSTAELSVMNPNGTGSNPLGFALIATGEVADAASTIALPGESTSTTIPPQGPGQAGVAATITNPDGGPVTVSVAIYSANPSPAPVFDVGGGFTDIAVTGADPSDILEARFYYPNTVVPPAEDSLELLWFDGLDWQPVIGSDGSMPHLDRTDNLDGTLSGGRFAVRLDASSSPSLSDLTGTVFAVVGFVPNLPPIAGQDRLKAVFRIPPSDPQNRLIIAVNKLLANDVDPEGGSLRLTGIPTASADGSLLTLDGNQILYQPASLGTPDSFTYTVADEQGLTSEGTVLVTRRFVGQPVLLGITPQPNGMLISFIGNPGTTWSVESAAGPRGPWSIIGEVQLGPDGVGTFFDTAVSGGTRVYRLGAH